MSVTDYVSERRLEEALTFVKNYYKNKLGVNTLSALTDVKINEPLKNGQVPRYNTASMKWENADVEAGESAFEDLTDTNIQDPSDGQIPVYNETLEKWENKTIALGDGDMKKSVYDTNNNGKVDVAENAEKVNNHTVAKDVPSDAKFTDTDSFSALTDTDFTNNLQNGQVPKWDSSAQKWKNADESGGGASSFADLDDTVISNPPSTDDIPVYIDGKWRNSNRFKTLEATVGEVNSAFNALFGE